MNLRRLFMSRKRRATVAYLDRLVEADRSRAAARNLTLALSNVPGANGTAAPTSTSSSVGAAHNLPAPHRQRPRPDAPAPVGSPVPPPVRVLDIEADVATSP